jgi:acylglycerol lipase
VHGTADKVTSFKATEEFYNKIDCADKKLSLYEVRGRFSIAPSIAWYTSWLMFHLDHQGGYHELVHDIDGYPERLVEECISWVESHIVEQTENSATAPAAVSTTAKL